eukprot:3528610-Pyramimonas_sp.AAC.2
MPNIADPFNIFRAVQISAGRRRRRRNPRGHDQRLLRETGFNMHFAWPPGSHADPAGCPQQGAIDVPRK